MNKIVVYTEDKVFDCRVCRRTFTANHDAEAAALTHRMMKHEATVRIVLLDSQTAL